METIGKIRRRRLVQGESISAIARDLGLARNTVIIETSNDSYRFKTRRIAPQPLVNVGRRLLVEVGRRLTPGGLRALPEH